MLTNLELIIKMQTRKQECLFNSADSWCFVGVIHTPPQLPCPPAPLSVLSVCPAFSSSAAL